MNTDYEIVSDVTREIMIEDVGYNEDLDTYVEYECETNFRDSIRRFVICKDEVSAMFAERDGKGVKLLKGF